MKLNQQLFFLIAGLRGKIPGLNFIMIIGAEAVIYFSAIWLTYLSFNQSGSYKHSAITSTLSIFIAFLVILIIHFFIKERRPFIKFGFKPLVSFYKNLSFPSIHTTVMAIFLVSSLYYSIPISGILSLLLVWVAIARIYIGVHYPIDILGGILTGGISFLLAVSILRI